jgi:hypothetical protein
VCRIDRGRDRAELFNLPEHAPVASLAKDLDKQDPRVGCGNADREDERERKPVQSAAARGQQGSSGHGIRGYIGRAGLAPAGMPGAIRAVGTLWW